MYKTAGKGAHLNQYAVKEVHEDLDVADDNEVSEYRVQAPGGKAVLV